MSFNQYRTNPSQAVSKFKGRTDTPKAWPSTAVSQWLNGGLFGGGGADTWFTIYSWQSSQSASGGAKNCTVAGPWTTAKNTSLTADGSVVMFGDTTGNDIHMFYQISPSGVVASDAANVGAYSISNGELHFGNFVTNGTIMLCGGQTKYTPNSGNQLMCSMVVQPQSNTNTSGTPVIEDFENFAFSSSWNQDRFKTTRVWHDDDAGNNLLYWVQGGKPEGNCGWVFGTYNTSTNAIAVTGFAKNNNFDWTQNGSSEVNAVVRGDSGRMYGFGRAGNGRAGVFMSEGTAIGQGNFPQRMRSQAWRKNFTYTSGGHPSAVYSCGTYNGNDQVIAMFQSQQLYGAFETYFVKFTPYDGQVQATELIYAPQNQGSCQPPERHGKNPGMVMDSNNNIYAIMTRDGLKGKEVVIAKINYSLQTQWIRCIQMSHGNTWNNSDGNNNVGLEANGINLSADEQYIVGHATMYYFPDNGQHQKGVAFRIKTDGTGTQLNSADAHNLNGGVITPSTQNDFSGAGNLYLRYYDPSDNSASPTPRAINVTALGGNWGSSSANGSSNYYGAQNPTNGRPTISPLANQASNYGNYAYENLFSG